MRRAALLLFLLLCASTQVIAQDPPIQQGVKPYDFLHGGDIDTISVTSGTLDLHIPLVSYPQRGGKIPLDFTIRYFQAGFETTEITLPGTVAEGGGTSTAANWLGNFVQVVPDTSMGLTSPGGEQTNAVTPDRAAHPMMGVGGPLPAESLDATGFHLDSTGKILTDSRGNRYTITAVLGPNQQSLSDPTRVEDSNGNFVTHTNGVWTDTVGRQIPDPPTGSIEGTLSVSFAGCPQGVVPTTATLPWTIPGPAGNVTYQFCYGTYSLNFDLDTDTGQHRAPVNNFQVTLLQAIVLPNGTAWTFGYNTSVGVLTSVGLPTGGSITYGGRIIRPCVALATGYPANYSFVYTSRALNANDGKGPQTWGYSTPPTNEFVSQSTTVSAPDGTKSVHTFLAAAGCSFLDAQVVSYDASGNVVKTAKTDYTYTRSPFDNFGVVNVLPIRTTTIWPNGQVSKVEKDYDSGFTYSNANLNAVVSASYGNVVAQREYDYGNGSPGSLLRTTTTSYIALSNSAYQTNNLVNLPTSVTVADGAGTQRALTNYFYDGTTPVSSGISTQHDSAPPAGATRGNVTSVSHWLNTTGTSLTSTMTYFDTGEVQTSTDPKGNHTTYAYSSMYAGAFPTTITNALNQSTTHAYDFNTGLRTSSTDPNSLTTSFSYDNMWRLSQVNRPDGGQDTITHQETSFPFTATVTKTINITPFGRLTKAEDEINANVFDGLGRVTQTQLTSDPQGTVFTDTTYDALGRVSTVSNPHRTCGSDATSSCGTTTYGYDALSRKISETYPDGSMLQTAYCAASTLVTDPTGKWRRSRADGLGRLVEVDEPNAVGTTVASSGCPASGGGEPIFVTSYTNDALGNLTQVVQNGSRQRTFTYDSLSRLLTSTNPEAGTITYTYDPDGNMLTKKDARSITTTYTYDALNREKTRIYSNGDPSVSINYDEANCLGLTACQNIGHRTSMTDAAGSESWSYQVDASNHRSLHVNQRTINPFSGNVTKTTTYILDLVGNVTQAVYPTGRVVNYTYDSANRPSAAFDGSNGITYATGFETSPGSTCTANVTCYTPQGSFYALSIGQTSSFTGLNLTHLYNNRLQPQEFKASSTGGNAIDISYGFVDSVSGKNAGHVYGITNNLDTTRSQTFTYDQLNRITSAGTSATSGATCWGYQYSYDAWGNLLSQAAWTPNYNGCSETVMAPVTADGNNHLSTWAYDASGNATSDSTNSYFWDSESRLNHTGGAVFYTYDGDGQRVAKLGGCYYTSPTTGICNLLPETIYWYGSGGDILAETDASGNTLNEYIFFGGKRIAQIATGTGTISGTSATSIPVQNASFETTNPLTISCGTGCAYNNGPIPNWSGGGSFQPNSAIFNLPLPNGSIIAWTNGGSISQTLTGTSLQPNSTYTLSVDVGHRLDGFVTNYSISLQAGSTVLATLSDTNGNIPAGSFVAKTLTYTSGTTVASGDLSIVLSSTGLQGDFDNVRLTGPIVSYYVEDLLGSSRVMVTSTGVVCYDADFTPFGGERAIANTCPQNNYKFEGKERDSETGNDDFGARYYSNRFGRWLSSDWSAVPVAVPYANLTNPQTLNLYSMVADDPESFADLGGHCTPQTPCSASDLATPPARGDFVDQAKGFFLGVIATVGNALSAGIVPVSVRLENQDQINGARVGSQVAMVAPVMAEELAATRTVEAVTDSLATSASRAGETPAAAAVPKEGIYEGPDATAPGRTYVGQSENMPERLAQHSESGTGKFPEGTRVSTTEVKGGKTAREIAEQKRIDHLGGVRSRPGSQTSNIRNPIGRKRKGLMDNNQ